VNLHIDKIMIRGAPQGDAMQIIAHGKTFPEREEIKLDMLISEDALREAIRNYISYAPIV
jgi:hypothetical protein